MPLFGPLNYAINGDASYASGDQVNYPFQPGLFSPTSGWMIRPLQALASASAPATAPAAPLLPMTAAPASAPPPMQSIGTFTTRRTQLFGPLSSVAI